MQRGVGIKRAGLLLACAFGFIASHAAAQAAPEAPAPPATAGTAAPVGSPPPAAAPAPDPTAPGASPAAPVASPAPAGPAASAVPAAQPAASARPQPAGDAACLLGEHEGFARAEARTATALMCTALRDKGAQVRTTPLDPEQSLGFTSAYRVALRPLGKLVVLHVSYEAPVGEELRAQRLQLGTIEDVPVAAPRVADALLFNKPLAETARVDNLVAEETRKTRKKTGETFFALGILGFAIPDDTYAGYGVFARFHYQTPAYAVAIDGRIGTSTQEDGDAHLYALSVGGRYFLGEADVSAFLGGGLGVLWIGTTELRTRDVEEQGYYDEYEYDHAGSGLAPFVEGGVELLRMHDSRLDVGLRVDLPLFEIGTGDDKSYAVPISLFASYSFD